jgi:hypothetical protein
MEDKEYGPPVASNFIWLLQYSISESKYILGEVLGRANLDFQ